MGVGQQQTDLLHARCAKREIQHRRVFQAGHGGLAEIPDLADAMRESEHIARFDAPVMQGQQQ